MVSFSTPKLDVCKEIFATYPVRRTNIRANVIGTWRSKPRGRRLLTDDQIRAIRRDTSPLKTIARNYDCSSTTIYHIQHGSIYRDVV